MADNSLLLLLHSELFEDNSSSDDSDDDVPMLCALATLPNGGEKRPRIAYYVEEVVPLYSLDTFKTFFRLSRNTFEKLLNIFSECPTLQMRKATGGRVQVSLEKDLLMHLWYMGSQECVRSIADRFDISESTFVSHNRKILDVMNDVMKSKFITWPPGAEYDAIAGAFQQKRGFPGVLGAVDGSHIRIKAPYNHEADYINRKRYHSVILQAVCRDDRRFTDVCVGWPGRVHDARVLRNSPLWECGPQMCRQYHVLGDGAYPCRRWLLTPYRDNGNLTRQQVKFNKCLSGTRVLVENCFGILKGRFRRLQFIDMADVSYISKAILSACILHNICVLGGDELVEVFEEDQVHNFQHGAVVENDAEGPLRRIQITRQLNQ